MWRNKQRQTWCWSSTCICTPSRPALYLGRRGVRIEILRKQVEDQGTTTSAFHLHPSLKAVGGVFPAWEDNIPTRHKVLDSEQPGHARGLLGLTRGRAQPARRHPFAGSTLSNAPTGR